MKPLSVKILSKLKSNLLVGSFLYCWNEKAIPIASIFFSDLVNLFKYLSVSGGQNNSCNLERSKYLAITRLCSS